MITLYQMEISPFCDKVRRVLNYKGEPYQVEEVSLMGLPALRRRNPAGKVPTLVHDGQTLADSTDIVHHLEQQFPTPPLVPAEPQARALCHVLEDWADESLYFYEYVMRMTWPGNARRWLPELLKRESPLLRAVGPFVVARIGRRQTRAQGLGRKSPTQILQDMERHASAVDAMLNGRDWLAGHHLSLADISVFTQLFCIRGAQEGPQILDSFETLTAWMDRVDAATSPRSQTSGGPA